MSGFEPQRTREREVLESPSALKMLRLFGAGALDGTMIDTFNDDGEPGISAEAFERRKRFARFSEPDAAVLGELHPMVTEHADAIVEGFYEHLTEWPDLASLLEVPATVERLKRAQRDYLLSMTSGVYDHAYAVRRLRIGQIHHTIGLDPEWYLGAYGTYLELMTPRIHEHFTADPGKAARATTALSKLIILDMQLVQDAYYGLQQKRAVHRSAQLAAVGELAASIAHEVRNPLAGMKGALQVLRKELAVKPANLEIVDEVVVQIERLEHLVRDLLDYGRPRAIVLQTFDLHDMLDRMLRMVKDQCDALEITVERSDGPGSGELLADPRQIEQVVLNLIQNSIQAMEPGGKLTVATRVEDPWTVVTVADTGKGIPDAELRKVFQPFYTTKHRGSGLGLSIVRKIAEAHGGTIDIESEPAGTRARLRLPRSEKSENRTAPR